MIYLNICKIYSTDSEKFSLWISNDLFKQLF